jgi:hypothetical protein
MPNKKEWSVILIVLKITKSFETMFSNYFNIRKCSQWEIKLQKANYRKIAKYDFQLCKCLVMSQMEI